MTDCQAGLRKNHVVTETPRLEQGHDAPRRITQLTNKQKPEGGLTRINRNCRKGAKPDKEGDGRPVQGLRRGQWRRHAPHLVHPAQL